jgi:hypothetical protein
MLALVMGLEAKKVDVCRIHLAHPIRAADWRSPLVHRLLQSAPYRDGDREIAHSYRDPGYVKLEQHLRLSWHGLGDDLERCIRTYQGPVITEFAALGMACVLVNQAGLTISEVCRRGEVVDYWLNGRQFLLEVSGEVDGTLPLLCKKKAKQLQKNPFGKSGFVCVTVFRRGLCRLWYYGQKRSDPEQ